MKKTIVESKTYLSQVSKNILITERELESIRSLNNYRYEKILFTMLVLGKYSKCINSKNKSKEYYIKESIDTIYRLAHTVKKKNENIFHTLYKMGFINSIIKADCFVLTFTNIDDNSETKIIVKNMSNIISFYPLFCETCGKEFIKFHRSQCICLECQKVKIFENLEVKDINIVRYAVYLKRFLNTVYIMCFQQKRQKIWKNLIKNLNLNQNLNILTVIIELKMMLILNHL